MDRQEIKIINNLLMRLRRKKSAVLMIVNDELKCEAILLMKSRETIINTVTLVSKENKVRWLMIKTYIT